MQFDAYSTNRIYYDATWEIPFIDLIITFFGQNHAFVRNLNQYVFLMSRMRYSPIVLERREVGNIAKRKNVGKATTENAAVVGNSALFWESLINRTQMNPSFP